MTRYEVSARSTNLSGPKRSGCLHVDGTPARGITVRCPIRRADRRSGQTDLPIAMGARNGHLFT